MRVFYPDAGRRFRLSPREAREVRTDWMLRGDSCIPELPRERSSVNHSKYVLVMKAREEEIRKNAEKIEEKKKDVGKLREALERGETLDIEDWLIASYEVEPHALSCSMSNLHRLTRFFRDGENHEEPSECLKDKKILDIACGSNNGAELNATGKKEYDYEPWLCRALHRCGAKAVGVDIGSNSGEKFEFHWADLSEEGAMKRIFDQSCDSSFDAINSANFLGNVSPRLSAMTTEVDRTRIKTELFQEARRLLKEGGYFLYEHGDIYRKIGGNLVSVENWN